MGGLVHHRWLLVVMGVGVVAGLLGAGDPAALVVAPQGGGERGMSGSGAWGLVAVAAWFVGFLEEGEDEHQPLKKHPHITHCYTFTNMSRN